MVHLTLTCFKTNESDYYQISAQDWSLMDFTRRILVNIKFQKHPIPSSNVPSTMTPLYNVVVGRNTSVPEIWCVKVSAKEDSKLQLLR